MPTLTLAHPDHPTRTATYGVDPERGGVYLDLLDEGVTVVWDAAELGADHDDPIGGALRVLTMFGFLCGRDVDEARDLLGVSHGENFLAGPPLSWPCRRRSRRGVRRVLRVIEELELSGG